MPMDKHKTAFVAFHIGTFNSSISFEKTLSASSFLLFIRSKNAKEFTVHNVTFNSRLNDNRENP